MQINQFTPLVREIKPINFLFFRTETRVSELANFIPVAQELFKEAVNKNLKIMGPIHWHYFGFNGDVNATFTLEVVLPVSEVLSDYDGKFHFKRTEAFKCVTLIHEGSWLDIPASYGKIAAFMNNNQLKPVGVSREVYINSDLLHPEANISEIQVGVQ